MVRQHRIRRAMTLSDAKQRAELERARDEQTPLRVRAITEVETDTRYPRALAASAAPRPGI